MKWKSIAIPKQMFDKIKTIIAFHGYTSVSEYVRVQVNKQLTFDIMKAEEFKEHLEEVKNQ